MLSNFEIRMPFVFTHPTLPNNKWKIQTKPVTVLRNGPWLQLQHQGFWGGPCDHNFDHIGCICLQFATVSRIVTKSQLQFKTLVLVPLIIVVDLHSLKLVTQTDMAHKNLLNIRICTSFVWLDYWFIKLLLKKIVGS